MNKIKPINFEALSDEQRSALAFYDAAIRQVAREVGSKTSPEMEMCQDGDFTTAQISIPFDNFNLRLCFFPRRMSSKTQQEVASLIRERIIEALTQQDKFIDRLAQVRVRVQESIDRAAAGMSIHALEMDFHPVTNKFDWYEAPFELRLNTLDHMLRPAIEDMHDWSARKFAGVIRMMAAEQRKRVARQNRLAAAGATIEVDAIAEALLAQRGLKIGELVRELRAGRPFKELDGENRMSVSLMNGRLEASGFLTRNHVPTFLRGTPAFADQELPEGAENDLPAYLMGSTIRIDESLPEDRLEAMVGKPVTDVIMNSLVAGARITSAKGRGSHITDLTLRVRRRFVTDQELLAA